MTSNLRESSDLYKLPNESVSESISDKFWMDTSLINFYTTSIKSCVLVHKIHEDDFDLLRIIKQIHVNLSDYMRKYLLDKKDRDFEKLSLKQSQRVVDFYAKKLSKDSKIAFISYDHVSIRNNITIIGVFFLNQILFFSQCLKNYSVLHNIEDSF